MELSNHFDAIVDELVSKIYQQVQVQAQENIEQFLEDKIVEYDLEAKISAIANRQLARRVEEYHFDTRQLGVTLASAGEQAVTKLKADIQQQVADAIMNQLNQTDVKAMVREQINETVDLRVSTAKFPENSIPCSAINFDGIEISGDVIKGGIVRQFGSTGIDDKATKCQITILDSHTVFESPVVATGLDVRGDIIVNGKISIDGFDTESPAYGNLISNTASAVRSSLDRDLFLEYSSLVTDNILERGIDFKEVLINGRLVLSEEKLGPSVMHSNLRRVGELTELQVKGESFLSQTLYTANKRVGINTIEPTAALTIWDEDVEILIGKKSQGRAFVGTNRPMALTIGANGKENISLDADGSVTINDLRLGALPLSTASSAPNWEGRSGEIVFNDCPAVGKPIGWVCLQGHRWAKFGIIQE